MIQNTVMLSEAQEISYWCLEHMVMGGVGPLTPPPLHIRFSWCTTEQMDSVFGGARNEGESLFKAGLIQIS
jgi:hypothetical protein